MHRRAILTSLLGVLGLAPDAKARKRKRRKRCTSGPCTVDACVAYVDTQFFGVPDSLGNRARKESAKFHCCVELAGRYHGVAYRAQVIACVASSVP